MLTAQEWASHAGFAMHFYLEELAILFVPSFNSS